MKRCLRDERVIVISAEDTGALECANNQRNCLELSTTLRDVVLIDRERLHIEVVCQVLKSGFIRDLGSKEEEPECDRRRLNLCRENRNELSRKLEDRLDLVLPVVLLYHRYQ